MIDFDFGVAPYNFHVKMNSRRLYAGLALIIEALPGADWLQIAMKTAHVTDEQLPINKSSWGAVTWIPSGLAIVVFSSDLAGRSDMEIKSTVSHELAHVLLGHKDATNGLDERAADAQVARWGVTEGHGYENYIAVKVSDEVQTWLKGMTR